MRNITNNRRLPPHIDAANERTASKAAERDPERPCGRLSH